MLVLSRRKGESVIIGDVIAVTVLEIRGDNVRLGFTAPKEVTIIRDEIVLRNAEAFGEEPLPILRELPIAAAIRREVV